MTSVSTCASDAPFLIGGGEMGALMRAHDWSTSSLGDPDSWPQSLRSVVQLMLSNRQLMFVAWGPELAFLYNDGYAPTFGAKHPLVLGCPFREVWSEIWDDIEPLVERALTGETTYNENLHLVMERNGCPQDAWFTFSYSPLRDEDGRIAGLFCAGLETTRTVLAERRQAFRLAFEERLRELADPKDAMAAAVEMLGRHLAVSRVGYGEVQADGETIVFETDYADGVAHLVGAFPTDRFGPGNFADLRRGLTTTYPDVEADPRTAGVGFAEIEARAAMAAPLVREGRLRAVLYLNHCEVREWSTDEVALVEEVAARTWDTLERARAEVEVRRTETRARDVLGGMGEGFVLLDRDFRVVEVNDESLRLDRRPREAIVGKTHWEAWPGTEESEQGKLYKQAMAEHVPVAIDVHHVWEDGHDAWMEVRAYPSADGLAIFYRDVTERRRSEDERRRLVAVIEQSPDFIGIADPTGRGLYINQGARRMCDLPQDLDAHKVEIIDFFPPEDRDFVRDVVLPAQASEKGYQGELRLRRFDGGAPVPVSYDGFAVRDERGEITAFATVTRDITERVRAEAALRAVGEQAAQQATEWSAILGQLGEGVIVTDAAGSITFVNEAAERLHGVKLLGIRPDGYTESYHLLTETGEPYPPRELPLARAVLDGETIEGARWRIRRPDGSEVLAIGNARPVAGPDGEKVGAVLTIRDDTQRMRAETELREGEALLNAVINAMPVGVIIANAAGRIVRDNAATRELWGVPPETVSWEGYGEWEGYWPETSERIKAHEWGMARALQLGETVEGELVESVRFDTGEHRFFLNSAAPVRDPDGRIIAGVVAAVDVTERRAFERRLRDNEARLRFMSGLDEALRVSRDAPAAMLAAAELLALHLGASRTAYADVDADSNRFFIRNDYTAPGVASSAGTYSLDLFGPRASADMRSGRTLVVRDVAGELAAGEGREMFLSIGIGAIVCCPLVKAGRLVAMMAVHQDGARDWRDDEVALIEAVVERCWAHVERVGAEARLRESEERYRTLFDTIDEGFCVIEFLDGPEGSLSDYVHVEANPAYTANAGIPDIVGKRLREIVGEDEADGWVETYRRVLVTGEPVRFERELLATGRCLELAAFRVEPAGKRQVAVLFKDVTGRKRADTKLRELNETLEQRVAEEVAERAKAEEALRQAQKMEAVGQLTGGIAHDFNNMLAVVIGSLDLLGRRIGTNDARAKRYVNAAMEGARRAALLTQRLLAFSRQQPLRPEAVDANKLVAGMSELIRGSLGSDIRLETVHSSGLWRTHADPNQLENALLNLAVNSRDAMPDGGRLTVETANCHLDARYTASHLGVPTGQYVMIAVTDTGAGMPDEVIAKAFDPFFTTKEVGKGTGLGLSQVYGFVKQSGGHVKIYSEPGQGTTVKVYLPRLIGSDHDDAEAEASADLPLGETQEVILAVEDEPAVRQFSVDALSELGYRVLEADGAATALRLLDAHPEIALLFTDVVMPDVNGAKLADEARRRRPDLKVLFTTGYTRNAVVHNGVLDPGVELIGKPFTIEELAAKVREVLDAPVPGAES